PLGLLALGLLLPLPLADRRTALVLGYPVALAASVAIRPDLTERDAFGPLSVGVIVVSLAIYLALALTLTLAACGGESPTDAGTTPMMFPPPPPMGDGGGVMPPPMGDGGM
ncbi:MAG: hypothetical protein JNM07_15215, partial [Phycisphaerae bacterium]|nr:hypothetical protein [Phycisphaerae bacterium]